ncbi:MAG: hypothetical protein ACRDWB_11170 [Acidimicrobiales bacterium]
MAVAVVPVSTTQLVPAVPVLVVLRRTQGPQPVVLVLPLRLVLVPVVRR